MKELAPILNWLAGGLAMWGLFAPVPYDTIIRLLMIVPVLALGLALVFRSEISLEPAEDAGEDDGKPAKDARPNLEWMLFLPACALAARACFDLQFVDWTLPSLMGVSGGAVLTLMVTWADPRLRAHVGNFLTALVIMAVYAFGALAFANKIYDPSQAERFETTVDKRFTRRPVRDSSLENHYVTVAPWGPMQTVNELSVSEELYESLKPGDKLCIDLYQGRFGWTWYQAAECW